MKIEPLRHAPDDKIITDDEEDCERHPPRPSLEMAYGTFDRQRTRLKI